MPLIGGVRPPVAILMVLLLSVAGFTVYALGSIPSEQLPLAVRDTERQIAADAAVSVRGSISAEANTLRRAAEAYTPTSTTAPATALKAIVAGRRSDTAPPWSIRPPVTCWPRAAGPCRSPGSAWRAWPQTRSAPPSRRGS
ncbi:hypothetical protein PV963_42225 [Streptomyces coeruleorubidus]|uniref:hypothetical protein n=1 Tax=Streptomyces coeruleorubidus TaxID=116188 RepID=UPI00237F376D|nr:hypothetical protein [Streptomyces coeruleorubidus]WDV56485.1 hypothetical protein PV963_42225 [Streptomyces coeruleorubidus]